MDKEKFIDKCREFGWRVAGYNGRLEIGTSSPAGEDFWFSVDEENAVAEVRQYAENYDAENHAAEWYGAGRGEPSSLRALLYDAEYIARSLNDLAEALENMGEESDQESDISDENQKILRTIKKEYAAYKLDMINAGAEEIWKTSMRATAWRFIKDFLEGHADSGNDLLVRLYKSAGDNILSRLVSRYMKSESYDIASWRDIRSLVFDYLEYGD